MTALVPAANIADRHGLPERFPSVILGEAIVFYADHDETFADVALVDLHVWTEGPDTTAAKAIVGAIRDALPPGVWPIEGRAYARGHLVNARFLRDDNATHGVVSLRVVLK
ncbi:DUF3168 domain-containing protein [Chelatococcus sambhunathii]|uniref:DUF3168 domain-containing protein n=1 Tax=Chelatococcus sambhunathii TaxID=363953 RepID=A0ABU1DEL3_9HYPH|nr:DUF3168 domain-containing protein [Chelatococcus sambhunathii]